MSGTETPLPVAAPGANVVGMGAQMAPMAPMAPMAQMAPMAHNMFLGRPMLPVVPPIMVQPLGTPQQDGLGLQASGSVFGHGGIVNTASGEWLCPRCRWRNFATRRQCVQCKLPRPMVW